MGCLLGVAQGSHQAPRFIVLEHRRAQSAGRRSCWSARAVTFDSGGISLKDPPAWMRLKFDMSGAAAVIAASPWRRSCAFGLNLVGLIAAVENMPGRQGVKPGDIAPALPDRR